MAEISAPLSNLFTEIAEGLSTTPWVFFLSFLDGLPISVIVRPQRGRTSHESRNCRA